MDLYTKPRWLRDLLRFLPLKSQFALSGNVKDLQTQEIQPGVIAAQPLVDVLATELQAAGFGDVLVYDPVNGITSAEPQKTLERLGVAAGNTQAGPDYLNTLLDRVVSSDGPPTALIVDFASRLIARTDLPTAAEHQLFTRALTLSQTARARPVGPARRPMFNTVIWIVDKEGDLPDWLVINNPRLRHIPIAKPDRPARLAIVPALLGALNGAADASDSLLAQAQKDLVDETEGLLLTDLKAIVQLARTEQVDVTRISDAVRRYKVGVTDDPWRKIERERIRSASTFITQRVVGQDHAVTHLLDIVKRASTGISGARRSGRPRGVAFLAGPTGVGKTELAKTITQLLFGDESAYIRFDMSEFSAEHADQRLIGAPPGYVGYDVGGELTNAIREKPFSVVLFDEIEKAHPRILDKFLQVLDDGVLTSGRGDRVYFSEALIIFTSNLGIYSVDASGARLPNVTAEQPFEDVSAKVREEIENHFKLVLNRPEILNRIGENIIVFDFIRPPVATLIFDHMVGDILANVAETGHAVTMADDVKEQLRSICLADLSHGGRGIRNQLEVHLINPLARALFEQESPTGNYQVTAIEKDAITTLRLTSA